jgi:signal transduction histidine kinase
MKNIGKMLQGGAAGELPDSAIAMLKKSDIASTRMINLINDFLNIEKIRHGQFALNRSLVLIEELFQLCEEITEPIADEKSVTLVWQNAECEIFVDAERILQVLVNLVCNAIKFSQPGGEVLIDASPYKDDAGELEISVKDFGRGIPEEMLDKVFDRYQQVEASDLLVQGGSGLGLSICKAIVELHGGQIWANSKPGEGTTFVFRLPLSKD